MFALYTCGSRSDIHGMARVTLSESQLSSQMALFYMFYLALNTRQYITEDEAWRFFDEMFNHEHLSEMLCEMRDVAINTLIPKEELEKMAPKSNDNKDESENDEYGTYQYLDNDYFDEEEDVATVVEVDSETGEFDVSNGSIWQQQMTLDKKLDPDSASKVQRQKRNKQTQPTITLAEWLDEMCAMCWLYGLTPEQFWHGEPRLASIARKRYEISLEERDAWQHRLGQYVMAAVHLSKQNKSRYPKEPFGIGTKKTKRNARNDTRTEPLDGIPDEANKATMHDPHLMYMYKASQAFNTRTARLQSQGRELF